MTFPLKLAFTLLAAGALLAACSSPKSALFADDAPARQSDPAPQVQVLTGEVLVVDGRHVRLANITTPQASPGAHCVAEALGARQARLRMVELAQRVQRVVITPNGRHDDYDRIEANVLFDGADPGQVLVDEGLAMPADGSKPDWCGPVSDASAGGRHIAMLSLPGS